MNRVEEGTDIEILSPHVMLSTFEGVNVAAPMVRYSKLPFRHLVSLYDVHITHTPMILAAEFSRSSVARHADFTTSREERGIFYLREKGTHGKPRQRRVRGSLIAQFAAHDPKLFADACELIHPHVDGIDLNSGCPQTWAYRDKIGCWLLRQPNQVRDLIRSAKDRLGWDYPISIKIRVDPDLKRTQLLVRTAIEAGANYISVHGRTRYQASTHPVSLESIKFAVECAKGEVPIVANGDAWGSTEVERTRRETGVHAVMSARGLLANPALFAGYERTPAVAIQDFIRISADYGFSFSLFHRHLVYMLESWFSKAERTYFNSLVSYAAVCDHLEARGLKLLSGV